MSPVYETDPVGGPGGQGAYLNLVVELDTDRRARAAARACAAGSRRRPAGCARSAGGRARSTSTSCWIDGVTVDEPDLAGAAPADVGAPLRAGAARRPGARPGARRLAATAAEGQRAAPVGAARRPRSSEPDGARDARPRHRAGPGRAVAGRRARRGPGGTCCRPLGRGDDLVAAPRPASTCVLIATPDARHRRGGRARSSRSTTHGRGPPGRLARARRARPAPRAGPSLHPLVALPDAERGRRAARAARGSAVAEDGDPLVRRGRGRASAGGSSHVAETSGPRYHAAAVIASNHLVALLGQAERVAASVGVPLEAYLDLVRGSLDNVAALGPARRPHRAGAPRRLGHRRPPPRRPARPSERAAYEAMARRGRPPVPPDDASTTIADAPRARSTRARAAGRSASGFVPTMGYLHDGHASLMAAAARRVRPRGRASIFVNPLQFGPGEDLDAYPRDLDRRHRPGRRPRASTSLFAPSVEEMYPDGAVRTTVRVAEVSAPLEGAARPTHFAGVATVVAKLFAIVGPCRAYFGEKDFQQLAVVRRMVARPVDPGRGRRLPDRRGSPTAWPCRAATSTSPTRSGPRRRCCTRRCWSAALAIDAGERDAGRGRGP